MKTKLIDRKRDILRWVYGILSMSTALFIFQACYGTPNDIEKDVHIQGLVKSKTTNAPIPGIKVSVQNQQAYEITDSTGNFNIYSLSFNEFFLKFEDVDSTKNGEFLTKDTVIKFEDRYKFFTISMDVK
jgi:putative lipoprotein (rSAM/lipoprotein system)